MYACMCACVCTHMYRFVRMNENSAYLAAFTITHPFLWLFHLLNCKVIVAHATSTIAQKNLNSSQGIQLLP